MNNNEQVKNNDQFVTPGRRSLMLLCVLGIVGFALYGML